MGATIDKLDANGQKEKLEIILVHLSVCKM